MVLPAIPFSMSRPPVVALPDTPAAWQARRQKEKLRGCIYARYSTRFQHSIADQIRACQKWAEENDVDVADCHVFSDAGTSGKKRRRAGLKAMMEAMSRGEIDVVITFATNRLSRKIHQALQFVEEEIVERRLRCVFVAQRIDTSDQKFWKALVYVFAMIDEFGIQMTAGQVREAHIGLSRRKMINGTLAFGYTGVPIPGEEKAGTTRLGRPRRRWAIDEVTKTWVLRAFEWYVLDRLEFAQIAKRLEELNAPRRRR